MLQDLGEPLPQKPRDEDTSRGWSAITIKQILRNPTIAGKRVYRESGRRRGMGAVDLRE
ncbi:recombinase family protein [Leucobacter triazinivorans]|uniref:Recombinase domain-containing protein n=1 Tax=Leucobacter triazinivorans TaxID=1784719 RepID=A0A4P6KJB5_9MICO|nr:hypothetical protein EVS81_13400 [Leucobacter triazinivorans]